MVLAFYVKYLQNPEISLSYLLKMYLFKNTFLDPRKSLLIKLVHIFHTAGYPISGK